MNSQMHPSITVLTDPFSSEGEDWESISREQIISLLAGTVGVDFLETGIEPWRLRPSDRDFIHPDLMPRCRAASGIHLRFRTKATRLRIKIQTFHVMNPLQETDPKFDLCVDGEYICTTVPEKKHGETLTVLGLPDNEKTVEIYFPMQTSVCIESFAIEKGQSVSPCPERTQWITHGSSITHCRAAASPAFTWPAIVARAKDWDLLNLGFGGQCKFDQIVARTIRDMPADRISLCLGINTTTALYGMRTWQSAVEGFVMTVRDGHPHTPLLIISPILSPPREKGNDDIPCNIGLITMRETLEDIVQRFQARGDSAIHYMDGLQIIGPGDESHMPDELHPDADGIKLMAQRFLDRAPAEWVQGLPAKQILLK